MSASLPRLWLCADAGHRNAPELVARVTSVLATVRACVWLRSPRGSSARALLDLAGSLRDATANAACPLFVGDRLDVAILVGADGVHLPERGLTAASVGARFGLRISAAVHDADGITRAKPHADVLLLSPFGAVEGKGPPLGARGFSSLRALAPERPFVALGGIVSADDARDALRAGADGVAVRRALLDASDPAAACGEIARSLPAGWLTAAPDGANTTREP